MAISPSCGNFGSIAANVDANQRILLREKESRTHQADGNDDGHGIAHGDPPPGKVPRTKNRRRDIQAIFAAKNRLRLSDALTSPKNSPLVAHSFDYGQHTLRRHYARQPESGAL